MSAEHAAIPWRYDPSAPDWGMVRDSEGHLVAVCKGGTPDEWAQHRLNKTDPYKCKAILISAAPDMLDALKEARVHTVSYIHQVDVQIGAQGPHPYESFLRRKERAVATLRKIDAAILKAERGVE